MFLFLIDISCQLIDAVADDALPSPIALVCMWNSGTAPR